jgi:hypothetical protein
VWGPDGKVVAVPLGNVVAVIDPDLPRDAEPIYLGPHRLDPARDGRSFTRPGDVIGFSAGSGFTRLDAGGRVNAENRVLEWAARTALDPKASQVYDPDEGTPVAVYRDGKRALGRSDRGLVEFDLATGAAGRTVVAAPDLGRLAFTPDLRRMVEAHDLPRSEEAAGGPNPDEELAVVSLWDVTTGARKWTRAVKGRRPDGPVVYSASISADGRRAAVTVAIAELIPSGTRGEQRSILHTRKILVIDGDTGGDVAVAASTFQYGRCAGQSLSHDGRLLAGQSSRPGSNAQFLTVWDATTGAVLKQWPGPAAAAFAPDRPVLATAETQGAADAAGRTVYTSSLGLWDLSGLGR